MPTFSQKPRKHTLGVSTVLVSQIPRPLIQYLNRSAGRAHSEEGKVLSTLAEILTIYHAMFNFRLIAELNSMGVNIVTIDDLFQRLSETGADWGGYLLVYSSEPKSGEREEELHAIIDTAKKTITLTPERYENPNQTELPLTRNGLRLIEGM
jgi:hypothetical protein